MEYEGYLEALPVGELRRQHELTKSIEYEYKKTREEIEQELSRRALGESIYMEEENGA